MITSKQAEKLSDLYAKPVEYKFSIEEKKFIRKHYQKNEIRARYAFYKGVSSKGCQIEFIIDYMFYSKRRSAAMNSWELICDRPISNLEYEEIVENFGTCHRRFQVWHYTDIDYLIKEDMKYNVETPTVFVEECRKRGYSEKTPYQLKLEL